MKKILSYFIKGLLFILPIIIVLYILKNLFSIIIPFGIQEQKDIFIVVGFLLLITFIGFLINKGTTIYIKNKLNNTKSKFPLFNSITNSIKKALLILNFSKEIFNDPVIIKREENKEIKFGFITKKNLKEFNLENYSSVYIPNPFSFLGEITIIENKNLEPIEGDKSKIINFILSAGIINEE